ncbi:MAG: hypothetical protein ACE5HT_10710 [Gemmatimonadales bacterium]
MNIGKAVLLSGAVASLAIASSAAAQNETGTPLQVGEMAPDFAIPGATRYGVLRDPIKLSDFRGKTVVLAFFYKVRTRG